MQKWTQLLIALALTLGIAAFAQQPASAPDQQPSTQQPDQPAQPPAAQPPAAQPPAAQPQSPQQPPDQTAPTTDSSASAPQTSGQTFSGTIVKSGDKYVLQDDKGTTYDIDHQDVVKKFEGKKVRVVGTLDSTGKMIHVQ
jgi:hemolysin activation/secretion protein